MGQIHSQLLAEAISRLLKLPPEEQDATAVEILALICSQEDWVLIAASEPYRKWLALRQELPPETTLASLAARGI